MDRFNRKKYSCDLILVTTTATLLLYTVKNMLPNIGETIPGSGATVDISHICNEVNRISMRIFSKILYIVMIL